MYKWTFFISSLLSLLVSKPAMSDEVQKSLYISPSTCVKTKDQEYCTLNVNVQVAFDEVTDFCIIAKRVEYKKCYQGLRELNQSIKIHLAEDVYFQLLDKNQELVAAQMVSVAILKPKKARPRRNLGWILF